MLTHTELQSFITKQSEYVYNPLKWSSDLLGYVPDKWQEEALRNFVSKRFLAISSGSGIGKTCLLSILILWFLSTRPFPKVPCTAPSQHQLYDVLWAELARWLRRSELLSKTFKWTQTKIALRGHEEEWFAVARTSRPKPGETTTEGLQGFHAEHILFIIDEASGVADQIMGAVDGALSTSGAHAILASNPTRLTGYFHRTITDDSLKDLWHVMFVSAKDARHADKSSIERIARIWGEDSDYYRIKVLGLPPRAETEALVTPEQVYEMHRRELPAEGEVVLSCDPARYGDDNGVFYLRRGRSFLERHSVHGMSTDQTTKIGLDLFDAFHPIEYNIDEIGIGAGVLDQTRAALGKDSYKVHGVNVASASSDPDQFLNLRSELFWNLRRVVDEVAVPFDTELLDEELTLIKYGWPSAKLKIESKDDIRKLLKRSPNDADAFVLNLKKLLTNVGVVAAPSQRYFEIGKKQEAAQENNAPVGIRRYAHFRPNEAGGIGIFR